MRGILVKERPK